MKRITLAELLRKINISCDDDRIIEGICDDSRFAEKNRLFIVHNGKKKEAYIKEALSKGAVILWDREARKDCYHCEQLDQAQMILLRTFYPDACRHLWVIGVTGTNGKTSVSHILAQMFTSLNKKTMVIGTGHIRYEDQDIMIDNTTPSACTLAYYFNIAKEHRIPIVIMEVSSHAIDQKRIGLLRFDHIIYTNIASDHLDYHITKTHYQYTKLKLRKYLKHNGTIIVNHDDEALHPLYDFNDHKIITIGRKQAHLQLSDWEMKPSGSRFSLQGEVYHMSLLGIHNMYNVAQCLAVLRERGIPLKKRQRAVRMLCGVKGRMELHEIRQRYVIIDYAHTASSLEALLQTAHAIKEKRLLVLCGCGGDRDRRKRPLMAQIALTYGDVVIFTTDNPRSEAPSQILLDMIRNQRGSYEIFENRRFAMKYAVKIAQEHDIIVIAGKGEEQFQTFRDKQYPFADYECIRQMLEDESYEP